MSSVNDGHGDLTTHGGLGDTLFTFYFFLVPVLFSFILGMALGYFMSNLALPSLLVLAVLQLPLLNLYAIVYFIIIALPIIASQAGGE